MGDIKKRHYDMRDSLCETKKKKIISEVFQKRVGYTPDFNNPKSYNEKIQWLKLYYQNPLITKCADKYAVKDYIAQTVGAKYVVPTIASWENPDQIDFETLPEQFVLKVNWSSGYNIIVPDKSKLDIEQTRAQLRFWMEPCHNSYYDLFNWGFKHMKPIVYAEEYLDQMDGQVYDYKFHICNGKFEFLLIVMSRNKDNASFTWFDKDFNALPFYRDDKPAEVLPEKPKHFEEMIEIAEKLAKPFPFVRVDFYEVNDAIYIGEMTFYSGAGTKPFTPREWDYRLGEMINLPQKMITDKEDKKVNQVISKLKKTILKIIKQRLKRIIIHSYYQSMRLFMRKKWQRMYIDYMEKFRLSSRYDMLHKKIMQDIATDRPDIMKSPIKKKYIRLRIATLATLIGEEPDYYWGRDYPGSTLRQRQASITGARLNFAKYIFNDPQKVFYLKDKINFAKQWGLFFARKYCFPQELTREEFCNLFQDTNRLVVKPRSGTMGVGFRIIDVENNLTDIYQELINGMPVIVEEYIAQTGLLHELNPSSLNTIRVITLRIGNQIVPANAYLRLGRPGSLTDNLHTGGVKVVIHMPDGKLLDGMTATRNHLHSHPVSGIPFYGLTIPRWNEVLDFCIRAHETAPEGLDRIGWDVCVDETHLLMIEGNSGPGFGPYRPGNPDCWRLFKQYFNAKESELKLNT